MAITANSYTGNGSTTLYSFTFPYLDESHVKITLNGTLTTAYTFANATTIQFNTAPGAGVAIRIYRETNNDQTEATFFAGSSIKAQDLNNNFTQTLYTVQEVVDRYLSKVGDTMAGILNMGGFKITNLGAPTSGTDATTKTYVDTQDALKVSKAGDTMSGNLAMGNNKVTGLGAPSASADAATKSYVDGYINTTYLGPSATDPTTRPGGSPLQVGDQYFNTNQNILKAWTGTVWVISAAAGSIIRWRKTASAGNTTLSGVDDLGITLSYVVGNEQVYLNGALQTRGVDYTAATGTSITLTPALLAGDVVELHAVQGYVSATITPGSINDALVAPAAGIQATKLAFTQAGTGATARTVDSKLEDVVSVKDFGAVGNGVADDRLAIEAAIQAAAATGGTVFFPKGTYGINRYISCIASNIKIVGDNGALIKQLSTSAGYIADGLRVGNPASGANGGTNNAGSPTFVSNITVSNLRFENCRISVWVVYAKNVTVENIWASGVSAAASGNDADCQCYDITFRNIYHTGWVGNEVPFYVVGIYQTYGFTVDSVYCSVGMPSATNASYLQIENSQFGSASNIHFDCVNNNGNGITLTGSQYLQLSNFSVNRAKDALVSYAGAAGFSTRSTVANGSVTNSTAGIRVYTTDTLYSNLFTQGNTTSLALQADAQRNTFNNCIFNPDGTGTVYEQTAGNRSLQRWRGCVGIKESYGVDGTLTSPALCGATYSTTGLFFPSANNLAFSAGGTESVRFNGSGVLFNGDTAAANALNDYEAGTWSPISTAQSGVNPTYTSVGRYTKIGRQVIAYAEITYTSTGGAVGIYVSNLPFAAVNSASLSMFGNSVTTAVGLAMAAGNATTVLVTKYDGTYYQASGYTFALTFVYTV